MIEHKPYLNLGCGARFDPDWINIDLVSSDPRVQQHDLRRGIPLPEASCAAVYHAAVLEHLRPAEALVFLRECHRVLEPGGIIRVGVPDLERLCRLYLEQLQAADSAEEAASAEYDWVMLEMLEQMVREEPGGAMLAWLQQDPLPCEDLVYARIGEEGRELVRCLRQAKVTGASPPAPPGIAHRVRGGLSRRTRALPVAAKGWLLRRLLGEDDMRALDIGRFRLGGEAHQWMYDRYSLARLLVAAGFVDPIVRDAATSQIPGWDGFHLDRLPDGTVIKPDLLFVEAAR